ncbi:CinA family protein [Sphingobium cloacae]|nr:CinA family protein [Sphingobium cloacae]
MNAQSDGNRAETLYPALPAAIEKAAETLLHTCCAQELRIATAESCTGGLLASLLTDVEGASHAFERGFVVYSKESKCELLGVARARIDACGAVSREVAIAMATGAINQSHADIALAVTGYAGSAPPGQEAGLVHFACASKGGAVEHREAHFGNIGRGPVRIGTLGIALEMMMDAVHAVARP